MVGNHMATTRAGFGAILAASAALVTGRQRTDAIKGNGISTVFQAA